MSLRPLRASSSSAYRMLVGFLLVSVAAILFFSRPPRAFAQNPSDQPGEEIVANLAAGRVVIAVVKDAILIATVENPFETQTHPPTPVALSDQRAGVILGAVDWFSPSSQKQMARLDRELPHLRGRVNPQGPRLLHGEEGNEATDIEFIGQGLGDRLTDVVKDLHAKLDLPDGEPLVQLVVAGFIPGYGPEVWHINYSLEQFPQRGDFWETRMQRPLYLQDWPPEKGHPLTLVEFDYPPGVAPPTVLEMLRQKDPRLEKLSTSDPVMASVASMLLKGISNKIATADATQFLRAALNAIAPPNARETMATIGFQSGFAWVLPPPNEPKPPSAPKERPSDAPSLLKPTGN
ncbi:MAG: hypothetical protein WB987_17735 [Candidatus Acidiferrales bacterium]